MHGRYSKTNDTIIITKYTDSNQLLVEFLVCTTICLCKYWKFDYKNRSLRIWMIFRECKRWVSKDMVSLSVHAVWVRVMLQHKTFIWSFRNYLLFWPEIVHSLIQKRGYIYLRLIQRGQMHLLYIISLSIQQPYYDLRV